MLSHQLVVGHRLGLLASGLLLVVGWNLLVSGAFQGCVVLLDLGRGVFALGGVLDHLGVAVRLAAASRHLAGVEGLHEGRHGRECHAVGLCRGVGNLPGCSRIQLGKRLHGNLGLSDLLSQTGHLRDPGERLVLRLLLVLGLHAHICARLSVDLPVSVPVVLLLALPLLLAQAVLPLLFLLLLEHLLHHLLHAQSLSLVFALDVALDLLLHVHVGIKAVGFPSPFEFCVRLPELLELLVRDEILALWKVEVEFVDLDFPDFCITFIMVFQMAGDLRSQVFDVQKNVALPLFSDAALLEDDLAWHRLAFDLFAEVSVNLNIYDLHLAGSFIISFILDREMDRLENDAFIKALQGLDLDLDDEEEL